MVPPDCECRTARAPTKEARAPEARARSVPYGPSGLRVPNGTSADVGGASAGGASGVFLRGETTSAVRRRARAIAHAVGRRARAITHAVGRRARAITHAVGRRARAIAHAVGRRARAITHAVGRRARAITHAAFVAPPREGRTRRGASFKRATIAETRVDVDSGDALTSLLFQVGWRSGHSTGTREKKGGRREFGRSSAAPGVAARRRPPACRRTSAGRAWCVGGPHAAGSSRRPGAASDCAHPGDVFSGVEDQGRGPRSGAKRDSVRAESADYSLRRRTPRGRTQTGKGCRPSSGAGQAQAMGRGPRAGAPWCSGSANRPHRCRRRRGRSDYSSGSRVKRIAGSAR